MTDTATIGIDLNGLLDVAAFDLGETDVVGGAVPSVVLASVNSSGVVKLAVGTEAINAFEGRGWNWPPEAKIEDGATTERVPLAKIIEHLELGMDFDVNGCSVHAADMMTASVEALVQARSNTDQHPVVIAIPDNGRFTEDAQQKLINALGKTGLNVHLLWRSVAVLLGMSRDLNPLAERLDGHDIAVIGLLEDGISINRLTISKENDAVGKSYIVPKRHGPGKFISYGKKILDVAFAEATIVADKINIKPWQVLWGDGLPLRWILRLPERDAVFQTEKGWIKHTGAAPSRLQELVITDQQLAEIDAIISDVQYLIYEGPALEAPAGGTRLFNKVHDYLLGGLFKEKTGRSRQGLSANAAKNHLTARGCVEFGRRRAIGEITYLDRLPQLQLAVRQNDTAIFKNLISEGAEWCKGGEPFEDTVNLNFSIPAGATAVNFYLLREGAESPRYATEELRSIPTEGMPIRMRIYQVPAQGRARLSIEADTKSSRFPTINVNWDRMQLLEGETKEDVIERLEQEDIIAPPVQPHPCHSFLWVFKPRTQLLSFSLKDRIEALSDSLNKHGSGFTVEQIKDARTPLSRYQAPSVLTRGWRGDRHSVTLRSRPVSSNGSLPEPNEELSENTLKIFDDVLDRLGNLILDVNLSDNKRNQIVTFCTWAFLRCPQSIRDHLRVAAEGLKVQSMQNDFYAMGRSFSTQAEIKAFFALLIKHAEERGGSFKVYHANSLFYLLSLREDAPHFMTNEQARELTKLIVSRLEQLIGERNYSGAMRTCLRAIGGLARYRLVDRGFLTEMDSLGGRVRDAVDKIIQSSSEIKGRRGAENLASDVLTILDERGVPDTILQWDSEAE